MPPPRFPEHFRILRVAYGERVTPRLHRIEFEGEDLGRFAAGGLHARFLVPPAGRSPVWPLADSVGLPVWPTGADRLLLRPYTLRRVDPDRGRLTIDVVLHAAGGPGVDWATGCRPGDAVGVMGPGGGMVPSVDWLCLAGDETALPAIARVLEELPREARGVALVEIEDAAEEQALDRPPGVSLAWLHRDGRAAGTTSLLADAVAAIDWPREGSVHAWSGSEFGAFRTLRHLFRRKGLRRAGHRATANWRRTG